MKLPLAMSPRDRMHKALPMHSYTSCLWQCGPWPACACLILWPAPRRAVPLQVGLPQWPRVTRVKNRVHGLFTLEEVVCGCLRQDPQQRHTAQDVVDRLYMIKSGRNW